MPYISDLPRKCVTFDSIIPYAEAMKILPVDLIRKADQYTIENEPIPSVGLMERAASKCVGWIFEHIPSGQSVTVFAGTGNNGGDGLAIARMLTEKKYPVTVYITGQPETMSPDCRINYDRLTGMEHMHILPCTSEEQIPRLKEDDLVIDAIFGSGLTRPPVGFHAALIRHINASPSLVVSIDVPSGLFIDHSVCGETNPVVVHADHTLTFAPPKLAFFFPENDPFIGHWKLLDIGLSEHFLASAEASVFMVTQSMIKSILRPRKTYAHKGDFGHSLLVAGSKGKTGAAVLSAKACLRAGSGLVTVHIPASGVPILQTTVPEAMLSIDANQDHFTEISPSAPYTAIGIGPGTGMDPQTQLAFKLLIQEGHPMIIDADAINILGENKTWLSFLPKGTILTPHPKEFERIAGKTRTHFDRNQLQRELSVKYGCYIVLKGAHTAITTPLGQCYFNTTGNPGMATGGSGDVLTGIITGLLAQHYPPLEACLAGVYLHGQAGDLAADVIGQEALIAGDIIEYLGNAFLSVYGKF